MSSINFFPPACSNTAYTFTLPNNSVVHRRGRTMDFITPLATHYMVTNRGESYSSYAPGENLGGYYLNGEEGFSWDGDFGFVGMTALGGQNIVDGMNEKGFTGGGLTLEAAQYQEVPQGCEKQALAVRDIFRYLFSTCVTVEDAEIWKNEMSDFIDLKRVINKGGLNDN